MPYDEAYSYIEGVRRGGTLVVVESDDEQAEHGMEILRRRHPVNIHERTAQWRQEGWTGADGPPKLRRPPRRPTTPEPAGTRERRSSCTGRGQKVPKRGRAKRDDIPVVEEDMSVGKHEVERGHVRIYSRVTEQPAEASVRLREEKVTVERRPADRPATDADFAAAEQEVIEMTETVEEPVVSKRARVVEEVVVHKEVTERTETVRGTVRHTEVEVQREPENARGPGAPRPPGLRGIRCYLPEALHHDVCEQRCDLYGV